MTIRSRALQNWHTDRCLEECLFEALYPAPSARPFSKGLLSWRVIPYFHFSPCSLRRIRARQSSLDFASIDDTEWRFAQLACCSLRRRVPLRGTSILRRRRAPSLRAYSYHMQYRTFISQPARYVAYERGKALSTSLPLTIRSSALHSYHTDRSKGLLIWHAIPRAPLISKLATLLFYDAPHQNLAPINLNPSAFTASHAMSER